MIIAINFISSLDPSCSETVSGRLNLDNMTTCWEYAPGRLMVNMIGGNSVQVFTVDLDRAIEAMPVRIR